MEELEGTLSLIQTRYAEALLNADPAGAAEAIQEGVRLGLRPGLLMLQVIAPGQGRLGCSAETEGANIALEQLATQISLEQLARLRGEFQPQARIGRSAVVTTVAGEFHWLGARMLADLLELDGWDVSFLGHNIPAVPLAEFAKHKKAHLVALSVTLPKNVPALLASIQELRERAPEARILVGGACLEGVGRRELKPAPDAVICDPAQALREARKLLGLAAAQPSLEFFLKNLGLRVQSLRKAAGWTQQQLAEQADLDRTYISAAEHGKQNLTLGAVMKLACALDVPIERLLMGERRS